MELRVVTLPDKTYKLIELVGVSEESVQHAIRNAITRASRSLKGLVKLKVGFRIFGEEEMRGA
jgi:flavin-binding protein dodecin